MCTLFLQYVAHVSSTYCCLLGRHRCGPYRILSTEQPGSNAVLHSVSIVTIAPSPIIAVPYCDSADVMCTRALMFLSDMRRRYNQFPFPVRRWLADVHSGAAVLRRQGRQRV